MKTPSTTWLARSEVKFLSTRGVNWLEASWSATIVIEKTTPVTVMIPLAIALRTPRAPSAPPPKSHQNLLAWSPANVVRSSQSVRKASPIAQSVNRVGNNQMLLRTSAHQVWSLFIGLAPSSWVVQVRLFPLSVNYPKHAAIAPLNVVTRSEEPIPGARNVQRHREGAAIIAPHAAAFLVNRRGLGVVHQEAATPGGTR